MPSAASAVGQRARRSCRRRRTASRCVGVDQQVRQEHRVVVDVGAAQVGDPGHVVDRRDEVVRRAVLAPSPRAPRPAWRRAAAARAARGARRPAPCGSAGRSGQASVEQVAVGAQRDAGCIERGLQLLRRGQAEHLAVDGDRARRAARCATSQSMWCVAAPVGIFTRSMPLPAQLGLGLRPVAAVGEQRGALGVTTSVPIEPVKPDNHSRPCQRSGRYSDRCGSVDGTSSAATPCAPARRARFRVERESVRCGCPSDDCRKKPS